MLVFTSVKVIGQAADPIQIVFMRYCGAAVFVTAIVLLRHGGFSPVKSSQLWVHLMWVATGVFGELCIISAPLFIAYEDATAISLADGVITMILAVVLLKERAGPAHWLASMTCLLGTMVIARADAGFGALDHRSSGSVLLCSVPFCRVSRPSTSNFFPASKRRSASCSMPTSLRLP